MTGAGQLSLPVPGCSMPGIRQSIEDPGDYVLVTAPGEAFLDGVMRVPPDPQHGLRCADILGHPSEHALAASWHQQGEFHR